VEVKMKNFKKALLAFAMLFVVVLSTACSSKDATSTKTFVLDKNGLKTTVVYTYIEKEDKVIKQVTTNEGLYANLNRSKEDIQKILDSIAAKYQGIDGIKQSIDYQEDKFVETLEVDYENLDYEKESFDLVLSRNLTWTLTDAKKAYAEWFRVLKPGGILLNFDANYGTHERGHSLQNRQVSADSPYGHLGITDALAKENT